MIATYFTLSAGSIFHVRVHTPQKGLEHALLYSIGVNLPAHRVGQIDRVLVLASPINDINIHAWDLNRVKRFMRLDIGVQMELCGSCVTSNLQGTSITFIVDKIFHDDCIDFLCHEARINNQPVFDNSLQVYPVQHTCARGTEIGPPSYLESQRHTFHGTGNFDSRNVDDSTPPELPSRNSYAAHSDVNSSGSAGSSGASLTTFHPSTPGNNTDSIPPRDITRRNHESAMPAVAHPYMNFQPQLFQQQNGSSSFDSPYQISSRIIITNSGEVQYERNILGNKVQHQGGFHFKTTMPLPPRSTDTATPTDQARATPTFHVSRSPNRTASLPVTHDRREAQRSNRKLEKRASELSDECDDSYVFIPDVVYDPSRVPLPQPSGNFEPPCSTETPYGGSNFSDPSFGGPQTTHRPSYEGPTVCIPPFQGSDFHDPSFEGSSVAPQPQSGGSTAPLISQVPISRGEIEGTSSFSGDYEDVLVFSQQLSIRPGNGTIPHVVATQEIRSSDSPIPVPRGDHRTTRGILSSDSPIPVPHGDHPISCTPPPISPQSRSRSPNKPQVKPRRRKPLSESNSSVDWTPPAMSSCSQKSLTIPNTRTLNSDLSPHHTLDLTSDDGFSLSPSPTESSHSHPHTVTRSQLPHPPLTPPIPRPRPSFGVRVRVQRSEDDIEVGRNRSDSAHNRNRLSQFTAPHVPNSDL